MIRNKKVLDKKFRDKKIKLWGKQLVEEVERNTLNKILDDYENWIPLMSNNSDEVNDNYYNLDTARELIEEKFPIRKIQ